MEARFGLFGDSVIAVQDRCMVCAKHTIGWEIILDAHMVLLPDVDEVEARFSLFGDSVNLDARWVQGLRGMCNRLRNHFGPT
jgi:hypothetical protein